MVALTMGAGLDDSTVKRGNSTNADTNEIVPALTIQWHVDLARVGEVAPLPQVAGGGTVEVSRLAPLFSRPGSEESRPIADVHLSRSPSLQLVGGSRGEVTVRPGRAGVPIQIDEAPLGDGTLISPVELDRGVMLMVAGEILLCLHRVRLPVERGPRMGFVGDGDRMEEVRSKVRNVADLDVPVLIRGETGTGKELVASALAERHVRAGKPFVAQSMAAMAPGTAAAALFGHERGAFTGAVASRAGYFTEASGGTLFLDEIGLCPPDVQGLLLRALETGEITPVGASRPRKVSVRVIAATDARLDSAVASGAFHESLFHRLARYQIVLPALRHRREDFGSLLVHFLREHLAEVGELHRLEPPSPQSKAWLSAADVESLAAHTWSGNVRELRNAALQIVVSNRGRARARVDEIVEDLLQGRDRERQPARSRGAIADSSTELSGSQGTGTDVLLEALRRNHWSPTPTAAELDIPRSTLYALMDRHPLIQKASDIPAPVILQHYRECNGDLDAMAERLEVSRRGLRLHLTQILTGAGGSKTPAIRRPSGS